MSNVLTIFDTSGESREISANELPSTCPRCNSYAGAEVFGAILTGGKWDARRDAIAVCRCKAPGCGSLYTAFYTLVVENAVESARLLRNRPFDFKAPPDFSEAIRNISPVFCETYAQACDAEENALTEICGAGFRRALEFLCKDFAISRLDFADDAERTKVVRASLSQCIDTYLPDGIKDAATRAAWLGNDETHYYRAWSDRDLRDLKALIQLTVKSIDYALELEHYVNMMPGPKK